MGGKDRETLLSRRMASTESSVFPRDGLGAIEAAVAVGAHEFVHDAKVAVVNGRSPSRFTPVVAAGV